LAFFLILGPQFDVIRQDMSIELQALLHILSQKSALQENKPK